MDSVCSVGHEAWTAARVPSVVHSLGVTDEADGAACGIGATHGLDAVHALGAASDAASAVNRTSGSAACTVAEDTAAEVTVAGMF